MYLESVACNSYRGWFYYLVRRWVCGGWVAGAGRVSEDVGPPSPLERELENPFG